MGTTHNLLWTGGWDSTYQLLKLAIVDECFVQPHYIDFGEYRKSTQFERAAMESIRVSVNERWPEAAARIAPVIVTQRNKIAADSQKTDAYARVRSRHEFGDQYELLARFCSQFQVTDLNLCIHGDDKATAVISDWVEPIPDRPGLCRVARSQVGSDVAEIFGAYHFPVLDKSKVELGRLAEEHGFRDLMAMTWFCHKPKRDRPCGRCNPCRYTIEEGLGDRIPTIRRFSGHLHARAIRPVSAWIKPHSRAFRNWVK